MSQAAHGKWTTICCGLSSAGQPHNLYDAKLLGWRPDVSGTFYAYGSGRVDVQDTSSSKRLDEQEVKFTAAETSEAGMVNVANLRHWRTTNKKPHLWLGAGVPWMDLDQATFETWLDARKKNGFTHIRGTVLTG